MLLARNQRALKRFGEQFQSRKVAKRYMAVIEGSLPAGAKLLSDYLRKIPDKPLAEIVTADAPGAKLAELRAQTIASAEGLSLVDIELLTGRMHQIRLQLSSRGAPVVGDWSYGSRQLFGTLDPEGHRQCLALHSWQLVFRHPQTAKPFVATARLPDLWQNLPAPILAAAQSRLTAAN